MAKISGRHCSVTIAGLGTLHLKGFELDIDNNLIDATEASDDTGYTWVDGLQKWSGRCEGTVDDTTAMVTAMGGVGGGATSIAATFGFYPVSTPTRKHTGNIKISRWSTSAMKTGSATVKIEFNGEGAITTA